MPQRRRSRASFPSRLFVFVGVLAAGLVLASVTVGPALAAGEALTPEQKRAVEETVRDYLKRNPRVILEALEALQEEQRQAGEAAAKTALDANRDALYANSMTPVSGNPRGDVTLIEFFDYQCGYCKRAAPTVATLLKEDSNLRVLWKEFPILGPVSRFAAQAALAADRQGRYLDYHVALMSARGQLTEQKVLAIAEETGLDIARLKRDMRDPKIAAHLDETMRLADALGIQGTPAFIVGNRLVPGLIDGAQMQKLLAAARAESGAPK